MQLEPMTARSLNIRSSASLPRLGDVVAGKYRVERQVGEGGMGVVFKATHVDLKHAVALKFLKPEAVKDEWLVRFEREARAASSLRGEHVVRVHDVGAMESGVPYIVMEYLEGESLAQVLQVHKRLSLPVAASLLLQACEGVADAHNAGIVHRDLKPSNLFCVVKPDGRSILKVLDFGVSKFLVPDVQELGALTMTSTALGSPLYMSPEQMKSCRDVDERTDIWSLGVILYELVTGTTPFVGDTIPAVCASILEAKPTPISEHVPDLPSAFVHIFDRCFSRNLTNRFANVGELAAAIEPFASSDYAGAARRVAATLANRDVPRAEAVEPSSEDVAKTTVRRITVRQRGWTSFLPGKRAAIAGAGTFLAVIAVALAFGIGRSRGVAREDLAPAAPSSTVVLAVPEGRDHPRAVDSGAVPDVEQPAARASAHPRSKPASGVSSGKRFRGSVGVPTTRSAAPKNSSMPGPGIPLHL